VAAERGRLRAENATRAVDRLMEMLDTSRKAKIPAAQEWAEQSTGSSSGVLAAGGAPC
jgi:hypothetical protein